MVCSDLYFPNLNKLSERESTVAGATIVVLWFMNLIPSRILEMNWKRIKSNSVVRFSVDLMGKFDSVLSQFGL